LNTEREDEVGDVIARRKLWLTWQILSHIVGFGQSHLVTPRDSGMNNFKLHMRITTMKPVGRQQVKYSIRYSTKKVHVIAVYCSIYINFLLRAVAAAQILLNPPEWRLSIAS